MVVCEKAMGGWFFRSEIGATQKTIVPDYAPNFNQQSSLLMQHSSSSFSFSSASSTSAVIVVWSWRILASHGGVYNNVWLTSALNVLLLLES